jgi:2-keto-4-pentenoate hydratase
MKPSSLAARLAAARLHAKLATLSADDRVHDVADAYKIQTELAELANDDVLGWKVTALGEADQKKYFSQRPVAGAIFSRHIVGAPAEVKMSSFIAPLLECELAFILATNLPARATPYTLDEIENAIATVVPVFELADTRLAADAPDLVKLADVMANALLVTGPRQGKWKNLDLTSIPITLNRKGSPIERGNSSKIAGNPLLAVLALVNAQPLPEPGLKLGQIVTTGTCTTPVALQTGHYSADFGPLGTVELTVTD